MTRFTPARLWTGILAVAAAQTAVKSTFCRSHPSCSANKAPAQNASPAPAVPLAIA